MAVFDVAPVLEGVTSLQVKLEDAITKSKLLLEAVEGSQSKYTELNEEYPVLRSLKGRLAASQGPNEALSTELIKFKLELESFVEEVFSAHDQVRKDLQLWANELERDYGKLRHEREEFVKEREKLDLDRKDFDALRLAKATKEEEIAELNTVNSTDTSVEKLIVNNNTEDNKENIQTKSPLETCDAECQTEAKINAVDESQIIGEQNVNEEDNLNIENLPMNDVEDNLEKENYHLLPCRSQMQSAVIGRHQQVLTAPVSKAKALLLKKQDHALRIHKILLDDVYKMKEEIQFLKGENAALLKRANEATSELFYLKNKLTVNFADRDEMHKKLQKSKEQIFALPLYSPSRRARRIPQEGTSTRGR